MATLDLSQVCIALDLHWLEAFGLWLKQTPTKKGRERSHNTLQGYLLDVQGYQRYFECENLSSIPATLEEMLNSTDLQAYFKELEKTAKPATYNRKLASLRMLVNFAQGEGLLEYDPLAWVPFADATRVSPRDVDPEELANLEAAAEAMESDFLGLRDSLIFFLMSDAGLRIHEVVGLKLNDLHLDEGYIHVLGKGAKHRDVEIGSRLVSKIRTWLDRKPASLMDTLITDEQGSPITTGQARRRFYIIRDQADVSTSITPHAMRHTYIYRYMDAVMNGDPWRLPVAIDAVCQQTGDRPEVILAYYTRARKSDIRAAAEALSTH